MPQARADISHLKKLSYEVRRDVIRSLARAGSGHLGGSLGLADVFVSLYFHIMNHDPGNPGWPDRDRLVLSIGHVAPVYYATLARAGYFDRKELDTLRKLGTRLQGHPGRDHGLPGIELSAGSLGQGLSVAVGMAIAASYDNKPYRIYSIHGDGELQEGSIWEAAMSAAHYNLDNLTALVDRNMVQIDGKTADVMELEPLSQKWSSFGWNVIECNGNDLKQVTDAYRKAIRVKGQPSVIIARTRMGFGLPSIEDDHRWHGKAPSPEQEMAFLTELEKNFNR